MAHEDIHRQAIERFNIVENKERDQRRLAIEDAKFAHTTDGQWDDNARTARKGRPMYTINKVAGVIDQAVGDQRQNSNNVKVRPISGGADEKTADILAGLIRNIEQQSNGDDSYDNSYFENTTGGFGGWRVNTVFNDDDIFDQDIVIKPIRSAASSLFFGPSDDYDKRSAKWAFLTTFVSLEEFKEAYPKATVTDFEQTRLNNNTKCWFRGDDIRIAEYWVKVPVKKTIALLSNGKVIHKEEEESVLDELLEQGITIIKERPVDSHKVVMYKLSGAEVLEGPSDWAGKFIPLIPEFGKVITIEDKEYVRGLIRNAKDAQRIYNYNTSASVETNALSPKDPYWMTKKMAKGHEAQLAGFNQKNDPFMFFNPDPEMLGPPQRTGSPAVQAAMLAATQQASLDIHATTGLEPASMGNVPEMKSGKAILAQQAMGDRGLYVFTDNHNKSLQYCGDILVDLIPKIYDTARIVRVLNVDGTSEEMPINHTDIDAIGQSVLDEETGQVVMVNDLTTGKYSVEIESGPAFNTQRQEASDQLIDLTQASPVFAEIALDLIAKNLNILDNDELTKRIRRRMIQQGTIDPTEEETEELGLNEPQQPDPTEEALRENVEAQTALSIANVANKDADTRSKNIKTQQDTAKTLQIIVDTVIAKVNAGIPISQQEMNLLIKQRDIVAEGQDSLDPGPNSEQAADLARIIEAQQLPRPLPTGQ